MTIGTITDTAKILKASTPTKAYILQFTGETSYLQGTGTAAFEAMVQAAVGEAVTLCAVVNTMSDTNPKYIPVYDEVADALKLLDLSTGDEAANGNYTTSTMNMLALCS